METGEILASPPPLEVLEVMTSHLAQLHASYGEAVGVKVARKHIGWYLKERGDSRDVRRELMKVGTACEQFDLLADYFQSLDVEYLTHHLSSSGLMALHNPFNARFAELGESVQTWSGLHGSSGALAILSSAAKHPGRHLACHAFQSPGANAGT